MTPDAYWRGPCMELPAWREADRIRAERENRVAWLHGAYVYRALAATAPIINSFSKSRKARDYPEPIELGTSRETVSDDGAANRVRAFERLRQIGRARAERHGATDGTG